MESKGPVESKVSPFERQFQEFASYRTYFEGCLKESLALLKTLKEAFKHEYVGKERSSDMFIKEEEEKQLKAYFAKKSTILVVGQINSGKSSFLNELLRGTYLPTAETPCTARIVRVKFSEQNYVQLLDKTGKRVGEAIPFTKKSIPKTEIALVDTNKSSEEWVNQVVEVGLNNSLLRNGQLELVDAPGMSENDSLDNIVKECLDGMFQVVIYVIDGNTSLRTQEREFLYNLKEKMGFLPIFFVCNKVDRNQEAEDFDRDSDNDDEKDEEEAARKIIQEKTQLSYWRLVRNGLLSEDVELDDCEVYHGVSTKEVRKARKAIEKVCIARRKGVTNQYTDEFNKMTSKLLKFATSSIKSHLRYAAEQLCQIQQRVFFFALSHVLKRDDSNRVEIILGELKDKEWEYQTGMRLIIWEDEPEIARLVTKEVDQMREGILMAAELMEFAPIEIGNVKRRNEVACQCRAQIQTLVLMQVMRIAQRTGKSTIMAITQTLRTSLEKCFDEVSKESDMVGEIVKNQLRRCVLLNYRPTNDHLLQFEHSLMTVGYKLVDQTNNMIEDLASIVAGTTISLEWKRKIAKDVIDNIDYEEVVRDVLRGISCDVQEAHKAFLSNVEIIQVLCHAARKQFSDQMKVVAAHFPSFAEQTCKTEALLQSLSSSRVQLGEEIRRGHRGVVYACSVHGIGDVVAKQLHFTGESSKSQYLAVQYVMKRIADDCKSVLKPLSLRLDGQNRVTILLPKMDVSLYDALVTGRVKKMGLSTRLAIVLHVTDACRFSRRCGLYHVDPRITNILLDKQNVAKLNVCKTRDDHVPYPDNKAPFHVPQEKPADHAPEGSYLGHDLYSLGVLLWLLLNGKYCRPEYAQTADVEAVFAAVANGKTPEVSCLTCLKDFDVPRELLNLTWIAWREGMADLKKFRDGICTLRSKPDLQTGEC